jgi:protein ImuB
LARRHTAKRSRCDGPLATIVKIKNAQRLIAVDAEAAARGLKPGMALADARAILPSLRCFAADAAAEAATLAAIADWCRRFTPLAALDPPDGVILDITGAAHLFGGEAKLLVDVETRLGAQGFAALGGLGPTPEAAWALARFGKERLLSSEGAEAEISRRLGALPLAALRLDEKTLAELGQAGLRQIGDILLRPRAPLAARFGSSLFEKLDAMFGRAKTPISPRFEAPAYLAERRFAEPISQRDSVETTIFALAQDLARLLTRHGEGARRLDVSLFGVDGTVKHLIAGTSRPLRDPQMIARLFREKIEAACANGDEDDPLDAGFGFDVLRLSALAVERQDQEQANWLAPAEDCQDLADLIDRLGARLGLRRVTRLSLADRHWPEFAVMAVPASSSPAAIPPPQGEGGRHRPSLATPVASDGLMAAGWGRTPSSGAALRCHLPLAGEGLRPVRLLQRPEPIEAIASVPDGPPVRFRWRRVLHEIAAIEGPERIAPEWWKKEAVLTRDYFCAEDSEGRRFWLFREGLYETKTARPRWFMHGLFA